MRAGAKVRPLGGFRPRSLLSGGRTLVLSVLLTLMAGSAHAACPALPAGISATDLGIRFPAATGTQVTAIGSLGLTEGILAYDSTDNALKLCDGTAWVALATGAGTVTGLTGDVSGTGSGVITTTIANDAVTFSKMQNIATANLLGRSSAGIGDIEAISLGAGLSLSGGVLNTAAGTASVAGSSGQIQFNSSGSLGADAGLHWDNTNKRLGIGTTAPGSRLGVVAAPNTHGVAEFRAAANTAFNGDVYFSKNDGTARWLLSAPRQTEGDDLQIWAWTASDQWRRDFTIDRDTGNIGLGTSLPARLLHLSNPTVVETIMEQSGALADGRRWNFVVDGGNSTTSSNYYIRQLNDAGNGGPVRFSINGTSGNVGIGTATPQERLDINGNIRFGANSSVMSKAPRVMRAVDGRVGCPPVAAANTDLYSLTFTVDRSASIAVTSNNIALSSSRVDVSLLLNGGFLTQALTLSGQSEWQNVPLFFVGTIAPGTHTISVRSSVANAVGCGASWGAINLTVYEH